MFLSVSTIIWQLQPTVSTPWLASSTHRTSPMIHHRQLDVNSSGNTNGNNIISNDYLDHVVSTLDLSSWLPTSCRLSS